VKGGNAKAEEGEGEQGVVVVRIYWERTMGDDRSGEGDSSANHTDPALRRQGFELAKAIRSEIFGYISKAAIGGVVLILAALGTIIWGYVEWRIPQIAGGVPKGAVLAFDQRNCPAGWEHFEGGDMRAIVGAVSNTGDTDSALPRHLHFNEQRGAYAAYLLTKALRESGQPNESEQRVFVPGLVALTFCEKTHE